MEEQVEEQGAPSGNFQVEEQPSSFELSPLDIESLGLDEVSELGEVLERLEKVKVELATYVFSRGEGLTEEDLEVFGRIFDQITRVEQVLKELYKLSTQDTETSLEGSGEVKSEGDSSG